MGNCKSIFLLFTVLLLNPNVYSQIHLIYGNGYNYAPDYNGSIHTCKDDGSGQTLCFDGINKLYDIALDNTVDPMRIYYIESGENCIRSANLDGSNILDVITNIAGIYSLDLDLSARRVYFTVDQTEDKVIGANMDGTDQAIVTIKEYASSLFETLRGITVDGDMLYWIRGGISCNDFIYCCKTDGSAYETIVQNATPAVDMSFPHDLVVSANSIFWTDPGVNSDVIYRMNKDKTNPVKILTGVKASQIALDTKNSKLFWSESADQGKSKIMQANFDGSDKVEILTTDINFVMGLVVYDEGTSTHVNTEKIGNYLRSYPNPVTSSSTIEYLVPGSPQLAHLVTISIYDMAGKKVSVLVNENKASGMHKALFDSKDLPSGIYFCKLNIDAYSKVIRLVVNK